MTTTRTHPAFTLVELLVCISIIALLIGLIVPSLAGGRGSALRTHALANVHHAAQTFALYANQYRESFPWHDGDTWVLDHPPDEGSAPNFRTGDPFGIRYTWVTTMHDLAPWREHYITWLNPGVAHDASRPWSVVNAGTGQATTVWPSYFMSSALAGDPSVWSKTGGTPAPRALRHADVVFPSNKAMLIDTDRAYLTRANASSPQRIIAAADGAARLRDDRNAKPPARNRITNSQEKYFDTAEGTRGTDW